MTFTVETPAFKGPLELLLDLVEQRKLFINEISLSKVADDYINYIKSQHEYPLGDNAQFILIASTLLLIKSRSLLPALNLTDEEEGSIKDLERRLAMLQRFRDLSRHVKSMFGSKFLFERGEKTVDPVFSPDESMTLPNLLTAARSVIASIPKKEFLPKVVVDKVIRLEDMIENLATRISSALKMSFKDFAKVGKQEKVNVIVGFLAMLELVKQGVINVTQEKHFEDIHMETESVGVPKY
jgi:segregation and condensation protein A